MRKKKIFMLASALCLAVMTCVAASAGDVTPTPDPSDISAVSSAMVDAYTQGISQTISALATVIPVAAGLVAIGLLVYWVPRIVRRLK